MTFISGTFSSYATLYTELASALISAGWVLEDTVTISTREHKIWKSPAASNTDGVDWYIDIAPAATASKWVIIPMDEYSVVTKKARHKPAFPNKNKILVLGVDDGYSSSEVDLEGGSDFLSATMGNADWLLDIPGSPTGFWISVTTDRILFATTAAPAVLAYIGTVELGPDAAAMIPEGAKKPLILGKTGFPMSSSGGVALNRTPHYLNYSTEVAVGPFVAEFLPATSPQGPTLPEGKFLSSVPKVTGAPISGIPYLVRVGLRNSALSGVTPAGTPYALRGVVSFLVEAANAVTRGDTIRESGTLKLYTILATLGSAPPISLGLESI